MNMQRLLIALTVVNLALLIALLSFNGARAAQGETSLLRGRGLELVDAAGQVRAQITIEDSGEAIFRMRDAAGAIRVKLGAGNEGSGLLLLDEATEPGVHLIARRSATATHSSTTSIKLSGPDEQRRTITP